MARPGGNRKPVVPVILMLLVLGGIGIWVGKFRLTGKVVGDGLKYTDDNAVIHWEKGEVIPFTVNEAGTADVSDGSDLKAVRRAFDTFGRVPGAQIQFQDMGDSPKRRAGYNSEDPADNENLIYWEEDDWPFDPNVLAVTLTVFYTDTGQMLDGDIVFNGAKYDWTTSGGSGRHDVENSMVHELGHFMGMNHNGENPEATMYPAAAAGETLKRSLHPSDIEVLQHLYGDGDAQRVAQKQGGGAADDTGGGQGQTPRVSGLETDLPQGTVKGGCGGGSITQAAAGPVRPWGVRR